MPGGIGAYQPYITGAGAAGFAPGAAQMGETAATTLGGVPSYLTQAGAYSGPTGYEDFMSPYQQDVIDKTLEEYDIQAGKGLAGIGQLAAKSGNLGGGREGVARAEYQSSSDRNRALLQAQMLQGGFGQAQQAAGQAYGQQMGLGQAQGAGPTTIRNRTISTRTCRFSTTIIRTRYSGLWSSGRRTTSI